MPTHPLACRVAHNGLSPGRKNPPTLSSPPNNRRKIISAATTRKGDFIPRPEYKTELGSG
eukprot:8149901-Pyramimonas_sp.AAC.1